MPGVVRKYKKVLGISRRCQEVPEGVRKYQRVSGNARRCQDVPECVRRRQGCQGLLGSKRGFQELPGVVLNQDLPGLSGLVRS